MVLRYSSSAGHTDNASREEESKPHLKIKSEMSTHPFERVAGGGVEPTAVVEWDGSVGLMVCSVLAGVCEAAKTKEHSVGKTR